MLYADSHVLWITKLYLKICKKTHTHTHTYWPQYSYGSYSVASGNTGAAILKL